MSKYKLRGIVSGKALPNDLKHFAGTVQVIKAVGNHLVLTFCHNFSTDRQFLTVILSRENHLASRDIHSVHGMLIRKGLSTKAVEKYCNGVSPLNISVAFNLLVLFLCVFLK